MTTPLRLEFEVACPAAHAFEVWTARTALWWPPDHTVSGAPAAVVIEPGIGGRIFERSDRGEEIDWGTVTAWDPPRRLAYRWHLGQDPATPTDVEIRFAALGPQRCRVRIEHRGWERLGHRAEEGRTANRAGWDAVLPPFVAAALQPAEKP